ncbi:MAG: hypothetical protein LKJ25_03225 [Clostridia bacterium]|nr:hypothetical protein [Clostridia bacterium]
MNITVKILGERNQESIKKLILFYGKLRNELKKEHPDIVLNIEVEEN